jgi:hypothetical protein
VRRLLLSVAVVAALAAVATTSRVAARFTDTPSVAANAFGTGSCFTRVESFQKGTTSNAVNGTTTVTISSVNPARAFLIFNTRHSSNRPVGSMLRGRLASATTVEFARVTDEPTPSTINIQWYVVEYTCGVNVQRGATTLNANTVDVPITAVSSRSQAFVTFSKTTFAADTTWDANDSVIADLTAVNNLQFRANGQGSHLAWWQVIEFTNPAEIEVQRGSTSLTGTALSTTVTIPAAVNTGKTFVLVSARSGATTATNIGARLLRARLTNATTITIDRSISGAPDNVDEIVWQAVELNDGTAVQGGNRNFAAGTATNTVAITSVDTTRAVAFGSFDLGNGEGCGRTPYAVDDIVGVACVTVAVTSATQLTLQRNNTADAADVGWFVVQFTTRT